MKSRRDIPRYAQDNAITLTLGQFAKIYKRKSHPIFDNAQPTVRIARMSNDTTWVGWEGQYVFWATRWYQVPNIVWQRAQAINDFVKTL